jgi:peptidoglycan/xylan/chitin deacetylase (PgdA/CDA1 family)
MPLLAAVLATILCWHEVDPPSAAHVTIPRLTATADTRQEQLRYTVTPENFRAQLDYLGAHGYHVIPLADLVDYLDGGHRPLPPKAVVITVDDGWLCAYTNIYPELQRRHLPWTLFLYPAIVGVGEHAVSWAEVLEMARAGVDVESHTWTHPFLTKLPSLDHELADSKTAIELMTGRRVRFLSYPYGDFNDNVVSAAQCDGYRAGVTTHRAPVEESSPPMTLGRYLVHNDTTIEQFRTFLP